MVLTLKKPSGKIITFSPVVTDREKFMEEYGEPFQIDKHNQFSIKYSAKEVVAQPSPDTSVGWLIFSYLFTYFILQGAEYASFVSLVASLLVYVWRILVTKLDKKAVEKFNNS